METIDNRRGVWNLSVELGRYGRQLAKEKSWFLCHPEGKLLDHTGEDGVWFHERID